MYKILHRHTMHAFCIVGLCRLLKIYAGTLCNVFHQLNRSSLVCRVNAVGLHIVERVEGRVQANVPLLVRVDIKANMYLAYKGYYGRQGFNALFKGSAGHFAYVGRYVVAEFKHNNVLSHGVMEL